MRRLLFGVIGKKLMESIHMSDGKELVITSRGRIFRYLRQAEYARYSLHVPIDRVVGLSWAPDRQNKSVIRLTVKCEGSEFTFGFAKGNPSLPDYADYLARVTGIASDLPGNEDAGPA